MKYIKEFEELKSDKVINRIKSKLNLELENEFSKYLEPAFIKFGKEDSKVFLFKPDFGVRITPDFTKSPYVLYANVCVVFLENGKWKRSAYTHFYKAIKSQEKIHLEGFVKTYVSELEKKYENRMKRILNKSIKKFNI